MAAIEPIASIAVEQLRSALPPIHDGPPDGAAASQKTNAFGQLMSEGLARMNEQLLSSQVDLQALATGEVQNLHDVMIRMEESRINFQLLMQVRGRLLEAYQDVMKMQV